MIKGPSNQKTYPDYYSGDPAFRQLAANASEDQTKEYLADVQRARETGDWSHLVIEGAGAPTAFWFQPMPGEAWREIVARMEAGDKAIKLAPLAFRACIQKIENGGYDTIKREKHPQLGVIATIDVTNYLDSIDPGIVNELGFELVRRGTQGLSPK